MKWSDLSHISGLGDESVPIEACLGANSFEGLRSKRCVEGPRLKSIGLAKGCWRILDYNIFEIGL